VVLAPPLTSAAAAARELTPSVERARRMWVFTECWLMPS
jgi:hypothetical protein